MWPFRKKRYSLADSGLLQGMADCHCHILPGVDDGIQTTADALEALHALQGLGVSELWLTPHIMEDIPNTPADLRRRFSQLCTDCGQGAAAPTLHLAAEHMLDTLFVRRMADGDLLPYDPSPLGGRFAPHATHNAPVLLVETSYYNPPMRLWELLEDIRRHGYLPLLAHPERYVYMHTPDYQRLRDMHIPLQLNLLSLTGAYGEGARRKALRLLHGGFYALKGTDLHNLEDFLDYAHDPCLTRDDIEAVKQL